MKQFPLNLVFHCYCQMKPLVPHYNIISKLDLRAYSKWGIQSACKAGITLQLPVILLDYESDLLHQAALRKAFSVKLQNTPRSVSVTEERFRRARPSGCQIKLTQKKMELGTGGKDRWRKTSRSFQLGKHKGEVKAFITISGVVVFTVKILLGLRLCWICNSKKGTLTPKLTWPSVS